MWNTKRTNLFWAIYLACSIVICFAFLLSCRNKNEAVWTTYFVPPANEITTILLASVHHRGSYFALFGDREIAEKRFGQPFETAKIFEGREWLEKIIDAYKIALKEGEKNEFSGSEPTSGVDIIFMTRKRLYVRIIGINKEDNAVYDRYMKSTLLKQYFDELGLTKELLAGEPNAVRLPQADKAPQN